MLYILMLSISALNHDRQSLALAFSYMNQENAGQLEWTVLQSENLQYEAFEWSLWIIFVGLGDVFVLVKEIKQWIVFSASAKLEAVLMESLTNGRQHTVAVDI